MGWGIEYLPDGVLLTFQLNSPSDKSWFVGDVAFDRLPNYGKGNGIKQIDWTKHVKVEANELETPAQGQLQNNLSKLSKGKKDTLSKEIKQLVQHGIIKKIDVSAAPLKIPSKAAHYNKFTKIGLPSNVKSMHAADPERDKREQQKQQIINKYIGTTQVKKPPIQNKVLQPVKH
jgi:hypothetical protein